MTAEASAEGPRIDAVATVAELRELDELTGGEGGSRRLCWGEDWRRAREWLEAKLAALGLEAERDEAGNVWAYLEGETEPALGIGSHLDSVPDGGWLDGALGTLAALGVMRAWAGAGRKPPRTLALVDFADEEGARFGRSLFGSSAVAGTLEGAALAGLTDADGERIGDVLAANGVDLDRAPEAHRRAARLGSFLELHIEQGPVLEAEGLPCGAVAGCAGVERKLLRLSGQAAHAGTTPMDSRRDAGLAAAATALAVEDIARRHGGVGTSGAIGLEPGVVTAVPGSAALSVDLRHPSSDVLAAMLTEVRAAAEAIAVERGCTLEEEPIWRIDPVPFDPALVELAAGACAAAGGRAEPLTSGALHDAAELAALVPTAMVFAASIEGISHAKEEDTAEADLRAAISAFGDLASRVLAAG
jgi:hydantoinase/carbamoylase family amidase